MRTWVHEHIRFRQGIKNVLGFLCDSHPKPLSLCLCLPARSRIPTPKRTNKVLGKVVHIEILNNALKSFSFEWLTCQAERSSWNFPSTLNHQMPSLLCWQFTLLMRVHMPNSLFQNQPCNPCWHFTSFLSFSLCPSNPLFHLGLGRQMLLLAETLKTAYGTRCLLPWGKMGCVP